MTGFRTRGSAACGALEAISFAVAISTPTFVPSAPLFFAVEAEVYQPGDTTPSYDYGQGSRARGALSLLPQVLESTVIMRASDLGYRSRQSDADGVQVYPPILDESFEIDRSVAIDPGGSSTTSFGAMRFSNVGQRFDAFITNRNSDNRPVKLLIGQKIIDKARGIMLDPPYSSLAPYFGGVSLSWQLDELLLTIPLADPAAVLSRPVQSDLYLGTGGLEGTADLAGKPKPMTRGGLPGLPIHDVPLTLVDPVNLIYQWTDGVGSIQTLYEGGAATILYAGDVADLYDGAGVAPGYYRSNSARGVIQLGSKPVHALTGDVTGSFPGSGLVATPAALARAMMVEDMGIMPGSLNIISFDDAAAMYPFAAGYYLGTTDTQGIDVIKMLLNSISSRIVSTRSGLLSCLPIVAISPGTVPSLRLDTTNAISVSPQALPTTVDPPPARWQVGWGKTWSVQTSDLNGTITPARQQQLGTESRYSSWFGSSVKAAYRAPTAPPPVDTALLRPEDAQTVAVGLGKLFQDRPGLYSVVVPMELAAQIDLGGIVQLTWPLADLAVGRLCRLVNEQIRAGDDQVTLTVLAGPNTGVITQATAAAVLYAGIELRDGSLITLRDGSYLTL